MPDIIARMHVERYDYEVFISVQESIGVREMDVQNSHLLHAMEMTIHHHMIEESFCKYSSGFVPSETMMSENAPINRHPITHKLTVFLLP